MAKALRIKAVQSQRAKALRIKAMQSKKTKALQIKAMQSKKAKALQIKAMQSKKTKALQIKAMQSKKAKVRAKLKLPQNRKQFLEKTESLSKNWKKDRVSNAVDYSTLLFSTVRDWYIIKELQAVKRRKGYLEYVPFAGANKADRKGKNKFVKGKIVSRTGGVEEAFGNLRWNESYTNASGSNNSPDTRVEIYYKGGKTYLDIKFTGRTGMILGVLRNAPHRIRILELALSKINNQVKRIIGNGFKN